SALQLCRSREEGALIISVMEGFCSAWPKVEHATPDRQFDAILQATVEAYPGLYSGDIFNLPKEMDAREALAQKVKESLAWLPANMPRICRLGEHFEQVFSKSIESFRSAFPDFSYCNHVYVFPTFGVFDGGVRNVNGMRVLCFGADTIAKLHADSALEPF